MKGKFMGLPVYVWLGVVAGGLLLGIYLRKRGGATTTATAYPLSNDVPANTGDPLSGLQGQSAGGQTAADTSAMDPQMISDLMNGLATATGAEQALTDQVAGLTDAVGAVVFSVPSSAGSGASGQGKKTQKKHPPHKHVPKHKHVKQHKAHTTRTPKKRAPKGKKVAYR